MTHRDETHQPTTVDAALLRAWPLPEPGDSKRSRGSVVVLGGAARSPGAAMLAGVAALRVGAGRLTLAVGRSVAAGVAVAVPECGVVALDEDSEGHILGREITQLAADLADASSVLVGPGLDEAEHTYRMLRTLGRHVRTDATVVVDAFALGAMAGRPRLPRTTRRILTPNAEELERLLERPIRSMETDVRAVASRYRAVVTCYGIIATPEGRTFLADHGTDGLGTSGSGDVLAGAIAGLAARGCSPAQAAVWGTHLHVAAGRSLSARVGRLGFLAREIADRLPAELGSITADTR